MLVTKAAILRQLNAPLVIEELIVPDLRVGQVLVKVESSGICGKQLGEHCGHFGEDRYLPHLMGHEGGGVVVDTGEGVHNVMRGDHVVMHWRKGAGIESEPPVYFRNSGDPVGAGPVATFTEYAVVSENRVTPIDKTVPFKVAALMGCSVTTAFGLVNNEAKLKIGQSIAVVGCGGVGINIVLAAKMVAAHPIIAIDLNYRKLAIAEALGATVVTNSVGGIKSVVSGGVDVLVDCTGNAEVINDGFSVVRSGGRMILVGQPKYGSCVNFSNFSSHYCGKTIIDSQGGLTNPTEDIPRYIRLYKTGGLPLESMITHEFGIYDINEAFETIKTETVVKCIIRMN